MQYVPSAASGTMNNNPKATKLEKFNIYKNHLLPLPTKEIQPSQATSLKQKPEQLNKLYNVPWKDNEEGEVCQNS